MNPTKALLSSLLVIGTCGVASAQVAIIEYKFSNGSNSGSSGGSGAVTGTATIGTSAGVTGAALGDFALDNTTATGMGTGGTGGGFTLGANSYGSTAFTSYTITGWFNSATALGAGARLLDNLSGATGFALRGNVGTSALVLTVNGQSLTSSVSTFDTVGAWVFFAVSVTSANGSSNVSFYSGDANSASSLAAAGTAGFLAAHTLAPSSVALSFANLAAGNRPYDGLLDNIRIFGATSGDAGALSASAINAVRTGDLAVAAVPEPSTYALGAGLVVLAGAALKRRRRSASV